MTNRIWWEDWQKASVCGNIESESLGIYFECYMKKGEIYS